MLRLYMLIESMRAGIKVLMFFCSEQTRVTLGRRATGLMDNVKPMSAEPPENISRVFRWPGPVFTVHLRVVYAFL